VESKSSKKKSLIGNSLLPCGLDHLRICALAGAGTSGKSSKESSEPGSVGGEKRGAEDSVEESGEVQRRG